MTVVDWFKARARLRGYTSPPRTLNPRGDPTFRVTVFEDGSTVEWRRNEKPDGMPVASAFDNLLPKSKD